jgi:hypothetical protein
MSSAAGSGIHFAKIVVTFGKVAVRRAGVQLGRDRGRLAGGHEPHRPDRRPDDEARSSRRERDGRARFIGGRRMDTWFNRGGGRPLAAQGQRQLRLQSARPAAASEKKPKDDLVQRLEQELEEKKAAWEKEQLAQDTAQQFSLNPKRTSGTRR